MTKLIITQKKSAIGRKANQAETLRSLGLKRIGHTVTKEDKPEFRGMIKTVEHLIEVKVA